MKKVLVTGGLGFIGSNLVKILKNKGNYNITVIDNICSLSSNIDYKGDVIKFTYNEDEFVLPHKKMHLRNFVLIPLKEIFPEWKHPKTNEKIDVLINKLNPKDKNDILKIRKD